jgi:hypothetical protein
MALLITPFAAVMLLRMRVESEWLRRVIPVETPLLAWSFIMHSFWLVVLTGIGMLFGLLLYGMEDSQPGGGLGSPNGFFTTIVLIFTILLFLPVAVVFARWRTYVMLGAILFAATFGWAMPYLSLLGPN